MEDKKPVVFVGAIKKDKDGKPVEILTPDGWVKARIAPVKPWSKQVPPPNTEKK